jgi:RecA-family ATPase
MPTIDKALNQLRPGYVTLVTGRSNDGKSTFVNQVIANAIENSAKVYWVSGEEVKEDLMDNFRRLLIGHDSQYYTEVKENLDYIKKPTEKVFNAITEWHKGKLKIFIKGDSKLKDVKQLLDMVEKRVRVDKYNLVVIDNLMSVLSAKAAEKFVAQSDFMQRLHDIASVNKCHIILVLHPNKEGGKKGERMDFEAISGAGELSQKADNIICVRKAHDKTKEESGINGHIEILKNRKKPFCIGIDTNFDIQTGFINEICPTTQRVQTYEFTWAKYLKPDPVKVNLVGGSNQTFGNGELGTKK